MGIDVDFDKICVFCNKCCIRIDKCVFIVVKIKCMNSSRINDICDKINFTIKLNTFYNTSQIFYQNNIQIYNFWQTGCLKPKNFPNTYILINLFTSPTFLSLTFGLVRQGHQRWVGSGLDDGAEADRQAPTRLQHKKLSPWEIKVIPRSNIDSHLPRDTCSLLVGRYKKDYSILISLFI
jgi:hypothetical protein